MEGTRTERRTFRLSQMEDQLLRLAAAARDETPSDYIRGALVERIRQDQPKNHRPARQ